MSIGFPAMKLGTKLAIGFALVLGLTAIIAVISWRGLERIGQIAIQVEQSNRLVTAIYRIRQIEMEYIHHRQTERAERLDAAVRKLLSQLEDLQRQARETQVNYAQVKAQLRAYRHAFQQYVSAAANEAQANEQMEQAAAGILRHARGIRRQQQRQFNQELEQATPKTAQRISDRLRNAKDAERIVQLLMRTQLQQRNFRQSESTEDAEQVRLILETLNDLNSELDRRLRIIDGKNNAHQSILDELGAYRAAFERDVELRKAQQASEQQMLDAAQRAEQGIEQVLSQHKRHKQAITSDTFDQMMLGLAAAVVFGLFVAWFTTRMITRPLRHCVQVASQIAAGELNVTRTRPRKDEVGQLLSAMQTTQTTLHGIIGEISQVTQKLAQGELNARIDTDFPGQFATIQDTVNRMSVTLQALIKDTREVSWKFTEGQLNQRIEADFPGDFAEIKHAANAMADNLQALVNDAGQTFSQLAEGAMSVRIEREFPGDFAEIKRAGNGMAENLQAIIRETSRVLAELASGNMQTRVEREFNGDFAEIRHALENTADQLSQATEKNAIQDWLKTGQAQLNEQLRGEQDVIALAEKTLNYLAPYLEAQVGLFYLRHEDEKQEMILKLIASYAYLHRKGMVNQFKLGEALVGQAALERKPILITEVPEDYIHIQSGAGNAPPHTILAIPFAYENELMGVLELGSFKSFTDLQLEFLKQIMPSLGIAVMSAESRTRMQALLDQSQAQAVELKERAEELQQQKTEMQETNAKLITQAEELQSQSEELQTQQEELRQTNELLEQRTRSLETKQGEIERKNTDLEKAKAAIQVKAEELEIASKYKSEFLANMSHELRTPLNSLLILAQLLAEDKDGRLSEKQLEYANTIHGAGADLLALINDILDLSKVEAGKVEIHPEEVPLRKVIDSVEQKFRHMAEKKGLAFTPRIEEGLPISVFTDFQRLTQILNNLLGNAFKFTSQGEISLHIGRPATDTLLTNEALDRKHTLSFAVMDTGIGIPADKQKHIFEAFQQADGTTSRRFGGTGLGLSISRELSQLLGGEIRLTSEEGKGSCFTLYLPERLSQEAAQQAPTPTTQPAAAPKTADPAPVEADPNLPKDDREHIQAEDNVILIVEDDYGFGNTLMELAREKSFKCLYSPDGEHGLELAEIYKPAAIILDINLPQIDGWSVMERLKSNLETRHIPVHFVSGNDYSHDARKMGAFGYSMKPVSMNDLSETFGKITHFITTPIRKLLIISDDAGHEQEISGLLQGEGIQTFVAKSGQDARGQLASQHIDCIILDQEVDGGIALLKDLFQASNPVPVVLYGEQPLKPDEQAWLQQYAHNLTVKEAHSPERLLDEATLFLHQVESNLPEAQKQMLHKVHDKNAIFNGKKILVVDDDMRNVFALVSILEDKEMEVITANTGKEGLEELKKHPDVNAILMDIMMPEMDGYEAIHAIRAQPKFRNVPILALTAKAMKGDKGKCIEAGASDYLAKPVETDRLLSLMRVWLYR